MLCLLDPVPLVGSYAVQSGGEFSEAASISVITLLVLVVSTANS